MPVKDTISEIQNYLLRFQRTDDDPIADNSKERVSRQVAASIKGIKELPKGNCNLCSKEDDKLGILARQQERQESARERNDKLPSSQASRRDSRRHASCRQC